MSQSSPGAPNSKERSLAIISLQRPSLKGFGGVVDSRMPKFIERELDIFEKQLSNVKPHGWVNAVRFGTDGVQLCKIARSTIQGKWLVRARPGPVEAFFSLESHTILVTTEELWRKMGQKFGPDLDRHRQAHHNLHSGLHHLFADEHAEELPTYKPRLPPKALTGEDERARARAAAHRSSAPALAPGGYMEEVDPWESDVEEGFCFSVLCGKANC